MKEFGECCKNNIREVSKFDNCFCYFYCEKNSQKMTIKVKI
ncbi:hypothetical protein BMB171_C1627 [Bacillus thuringiensis BMB171]|nr:hypothetical protein BMB171_C1627 [Bacillus thuringiensis BMB171]